MNWHLAENGLGSLSKSGVPGFDKLPSSLSLRVEDTRAAPAQVKHGYPGMVTTYKRFL
jgi:hypothetical protein